MKWNQFLVKLEGDEHFPSLKFVGSKQSDFDSLDWDSGGPTA